ncbi:alpha-amylase family glycosyl hydrolase [Alteromonas sp. W364]|uniref:alpha-amylase family glycosyl hydrolase n=1 Tax=Alteromonas sp. W364 TaxID=3075610 RepID=UPI0028871651|nr:alpha-amylase family glycosyl hydrolase [Alteromonas sp. W364]MDT0627523.1 alpha-amylase family glycosyl hydrolase [Alteromonas sp. W364]
MTARLATYSPFHHIVVFCRFLVCLLSVSALSACQSDKASTSQLASPDWGEQKVYFVLLDRFNDGESSNNDFGQGEYSPTQESHFNGGDIQGLIDKLDYIQGMGFTAVWVSPPVLNQWWSPKAEYGGYHGYWAKNFKQIDPHFGNLDDYKALAKALHSRGMYLIQDIVVNHTGIFFSYKGNEFNPNSPLTNFYLSAPKEDTYDAPTQSPFDQINLLNPSHEKAAIYHWTPELENFDSVEQQYTYQLGGLADLNTSNEAVLAALKESYKYWIEEVGVDAFRIDTVKYVEHDFWHRFLHDEDGIYPFAESLGKKHFLTFGEVFQFSEPLQNDGEKAIAEYLGTGEKPELNAVINFPLYKDISRVFAQGIATEELAYRLQQHMEVFPHPRFTPTFIDNHDTPRFLAGGSQDAMLQSLALLYTTPGIPVVYQGTEQALLETRQSMFAGGFASQQSHFNTHSSFYMHIQKLAAIREQQSAFTEGKLRILKSQSFGPGVLAYQLTSVHEHSDKSESALVLMNTAEHTVVTGNMSTSFGANNQLNTLFAHKVEPTQSIVTNNNGDLQLVLAARAIMILESGQTFSTTSHGEPSKQTLAPFSVNGLENIAGLTFTDDTGIQGSSNRPNAQLAFILDGMWDERITVNTDENGNWDYTLQIKDLGRMTKTLMIYDTASQALSETATFTAVQNRATQEVRVSDPQNDDVGPTGTYQNLQHTQSGKQRDILELQARTGGTNLQITVKMQEVSEVWAPAFGFDNVSFSLFLHVPELANKNASATSVLPMMNASVPEGFNTNTWHIGHVAFGWGNYLFDASTANSERRGQNLGSAPAIHVNHDENTVTFTYSGKAMGISDWSNTSIYISTWDIAGEGHYRKISKEGGLWEFGGGDSTSPKVLDDAFLQLHN